MSQHVIPKKTNDNDGETIRPAFSEVPNGPRLSYDLPFDKACAKHVEASFHAERVYILASGSLCRNTKYVEQLRNALGSRVAGLRVANKAFPAMHRVAKHAVIHDIALKAALTQLRDKQKRHISKLRCRARERHLRKAGLGETHNKNPLPGVRLCRDPNSGAVLDGTCDHNGSA